MIILLRSTRDALKLSVFKWMPGGTGGKLVIYILGFSQHREFST